MIPLALVIAVVVVIVLVVLAEIVAAVLPLIIVVTLVPPEQRGDLARVLAACDSSRKLRIWTTLRAAVIARRTDLDPNVNTARDVEQQFRHARAQEPGINAPHLSVPGLDQPRSPAA